MAMSHQAKIPISNRLHLEDLHGDNNTSLATAAHQRVATLGLQHPNSE
jgi:hypothetical protein